MYQLSIILAESLPKQPWVGFGNTTLFQIVLSPPESLWVTLMDHFCDKSLFCLNQPESISLLSSHLTDTLFIVYCIQHILFLETVCSLSSLTTKSQVDQLTCLHLSILDLKQQGVESEKDIMSEGLLWWLSSKGSVCNAGDLDLIPGAGHRNPLQYSCLAHPMDRGAWWATVCGVTKSQTQLKQLSTHTHTSCQNQKRLQQLSKCRSRDSPGEESLFNATPVLALTARRIV